MNLERHEWDYQKDKLVELGFPQVLNMSAEEYVESLSRFRRPERVNRYNIPVLVDPRPKLAEQLRIHKIDLTRLSDRHRLSISQVEELLSDHVAQGILPSPYQIWIATRPKPLAPFQSLYEFEEMIGDQSSGLTLIESLAVLREYPNFLQEGPILATKDKDGKGYYPYIYTYLDRQRVRALDIDDGFSPPSGFPIRCYRVV